MTIASIRTGSTKIVGLLNQPGIKEGVKNIASIAALTFGTIAAYDGYQILRGREISNETNPHFPQWAQTANKAVLVCTKISLLLSAVTSRPGVFILGTISKHVFSSNQLERAFGPKRLLTNSVSC